MQDYRRFKSILDQHDFFIKNKEMTVWGSVNDEDEQRIIELTEMASEIPGPIIEVGGLFGLTTQLIATYKPQDKRLISIENFSWNPFGLPKQDHKTIMERVLRYNIMHSNTEIYDGNKKDFYNSFKGETPAMVFIDADHSYQSVMNDIEWAQQNKIPLICGHDYCELHPSVKAAVNESFGEDIQVKGTIWSHCSLSMKNSQ